MLKLGAAMTHGIARIVLVGVNRVDSVFYDADRVECVVDITALLALLGIAP